MLPLIALLTRFLLVQHPSHQRSRKVLLSVAAQAARNGWTDRDIIE